MEEKKPTKEDTARVRDSAVCATSGMTTFSTSVSSPATESSTPPGCARYPTRQSASEPVRSRSRQAQTVEIQGVKYEKLDELFAFGSAQTVCRPAEPARKDVRPVVSCKGTDLRLRARRYIFAREEDQRKVLFRYARRRSAAQVQDSGRRMSEQLRQAAAERPRRRRDQTSGSRHGEMPRMQGMSGRIGLPGRSGGQDR